VFLFAIISMCSPETEDINASSLQAADLWLVVIVIFW